MVATIPRFTKTLKTCKKKFNLLFKQYKSNKLAIDISRDERHECKFYESIDQWWHQVGTFMKLVTAFANEMELLQCEDNIELVEKQLISKATSQFATKSGKKNFHEQAIGMFTIMVENNIIMVIQFQEN